MEGDRRMKAPSLVHLLRQPLVETSTPPLLLLLHGVGSNEHDLFALAPFLDERFLIISVRAPNTQAPGSYAWFEVDFTRPDLIAGAVLMSGRILPEIQPLIASSEALENLPFLVVHGTADTVLPINHGRASRQLLSSLPVELTYHEYPMGHEVSQESLADVAAWLSTHLDRAHPREEN